MKSIYIVVTLWVLVITFGALYFSKVKELRQDLGRAVNNTEAAVKLSESYKHQRDSLQTIINNQNVKP